MITSGLTFTKLEGYSGIRLKNNVPLYFKPGINLIVGRNGCGKTNLLRLIQGISMQRGEVTNQIETSYLLNKYIPFIKDGDFDRRNLQLPPINIAVYDLNREGGRLTLDLTKVDQLSVLMNLLRSGKNFSGHFQAKYSHTTPTTHTFISYNQSVPKFENSGYLLHTNLFSNDPNNKAQALIKEPIQVVSDFIKGRLIEFFSSEAFSEKIKDLEASINYQFAQFLGSTDKQAHIDIDEITTTGQVSLSLMDRGNYIHSSDLSTGEAGLFNLIFSLISAKNEQNDFLFLDEPEIHMHEDMVQVLVDELVAVSKTLPNCIMIVATHSTAFIEKLALLGKDLVNVITFDHDRNVSNSQNDIDLINALNRNGVMFSPLMLSKRNNLFIENQLKDGKSHKDFLLKFFRSDNLPNVIPIGSSGNVDDSNSFKSIFEEITDTSSIKAFGIQDGDMWFKPLLTKYILDKIDLESCLSGLINLDSLYVKKSPEKTESYYFAFWEIENLYLMDELLGCWKKGDEVLTKEMYLNLLKENRKIIFESYLNTFLKSIERLKLNNGSIEKAQMKLRGKYNEINDILAERNKIENRLTSLVDSILANSLTNWVPGKEIKNCLEKLGYKFSDVEFDFENSSVSKGVQEILNK